MSKRQFDSAEELITNYVKILQDREKTLSELNQAKNGTSFSTEDWYSLHARLCAILAKNDVDSPELKDWYLFSSLRLIHSILSRINNLNPKFVSGKAFLYTILRMVSKYRSENSHYCFVDLSKWSPTFERLVLVQFAGDLDFTNELVFLKLFCQFANIPLNTKALDYSKQVASKRDTFYHLPSQVAYVCLHLALPANTQLLRRISNITGYSMNDPTLIQLKDDINATLQ